MRLPFFLLSFLIAFSSFAQEEQDTAWRKGGSFSFFLQQVGLRNWSGGGESAISYGSQVLLFADHITKGHTWENSFETGYGLIKKENVVTRKNVDFLILKSRYGNFFAPKWQWSGILDFRTQYTPGYDYTIDPATNAERRTLISDFMAPGYLQAILGVTYRPNDRFNATFSPLANKMTFVFNDSLSNAGAYGVEPGERMMHELGASLSANVQRQLMENVNLKTSLLLFSAYSEMSHVDVFWDLFLDMQINRWLSANFTLQMIYDHDVDIEDDEGNFGPRTQLRNVLNVGIAFSLGDKPVKED
jgi:hypothetical protein